jgi:hypothetical protein
VETNGAVRVIAQAQNLGAPTATNSVLAIRRYGEPATPLAAADVPMLEPGRLAQVALDLPPGTQPEGETIYRLFADETRVTGDVDMSNNTAAFAVNLWLDADADRMPDGWEQANGLDAHNPADAALDNDSDGLSNLAEYRTGTDPNDRCSYLRIASISVAGANGVQVAWGSTANHLYSIQRSADLEAGNGGFATLSQHILATAPENVYWDATATNSGPYFYRVKVE